MPQTWTGRSGWTLTRDGARLLLEAGGRAVELEGADAARLTVRWRWFRRCLVLAHPNGGAPRRMAGVRLRDAKGISAAATRVATRGAVREPLALAAEREAVFERLISTRVRKQRWIEHDDAAAVLAGLPRSGDVRDRLDASHRDGLGHHLTDGERRTLAFLDQDHLARVDAANREIARRERERGRAFFDRVESSPLTDEQIHAVVSYDNRVRVVAAAGSGKTSVMVARAAYAIRRGFVRPDRVLMLAFNADAAAELQERVDTRLGALSLPRDGLTASTFHAFGLSVIAEATGHRPRIAPWVEGGRDVEKVQEIVDRLRDSDLDFRYRWDLFRLLHGKATAMSAPDGYDPETGATGFATYRGETVASEGERLLADWLFLNGVEYRHRAPYPHTVADPTHGTYRPTFHYPAADVWHEHRDPHGDGEDRFHRREESLRWRRQLHARHGTALIVTEHHEIQDHAGLDALARTLEALGLALDWNPDRPLPGAEPLEHERLARLVRTFMSHVKSSALSREDLEARLVGDLDSPRTRLFLGLYWRIHDAWQDALRTTGTVDFDDMLLTAAELVERDPRLARYDLVMVDEFQDTSRARARLTRALLRDRGTYLLAVGDDWQAVNRFAGADPTVMTRFAEFFGPALTRRLETTFRTTQTTADVAGRFVSRNPAQLAKTIRSAHGPGGTPVTVIRVGSDDAVTAAVESHLARLAAQAPGTVQVLGRYGADRAVMPRRRFDGLEVEFRTVHRSKGLEADHVVLPHVTSGRYGFPSTIPDDPVLRLAMAADDGFAHSEERRLMYVALTRARRTVTLVTVAGRESPFVLELLEDPDVELRGADGEDGTPVRVCPSCGEGTLVARTGRHGDFLGCSTFPRCRETARV